MSLPKQKFRELVFQLLYSSDLGKSDTKALTKLLMKEQSVTRQTVLQALERAEHILHLSEEFDQLLEAMSKEYALDRIQVIERNILRLSLFEMLHEKLPPKISISESIRLARKFGTAASSKFINAILDAIQKEQGLGEVVEEGDSNQ